MRREEKVETARQFKLTDGRFARNVLFFLGQGIYNVGVEGAFLRRMPKGVQKHA